jgi:hypothetical protein
VSLVPANRLPSDPDRLEARREARAILDAYKGFLAAPAFAQNVDLNVLTKMAADEKTPPREKRRAAEMLMAFRFKAMEQIASLSATREQVMQELGIDLAPKLAPTYTQVNAQVNLNTENSHGARADLERLLADPSLARLVAAAQRRLDVRPGDDGAAPDQGPLRDPSAPGPAVVGGDGDGAERGAAPGADAPAPREERDVQHLDPGLVPEPLA